MNTPRAQALAILMTMSIGLVSCGSTPVAIEAGPGAPVATLPVVSLPPGATLVTEQSVVMGTGDQWVGRLVMQVGRDGDKAFQYFVETYPRQGWNLVSAVRAQKSLMVLTRDERTATIEVSEPNWLGASTATVTITPRNAGAQNPRKL